MSLDALAEELGRFIAALDAFTEVLRSTESERSAAEERLTGLWEDTFRREFEAAHERYAGPVARFTGHDAAMYRQFLALKRHQVEAYLRGQ